MEKLCSSKAFLKMGWEDAHPSSYPLPLAISYKNHEKSLARFSHLAPLVLFFFTKSRVKRGGGGHVTMPPP